MTNYLVTVGGFHSGTHELVVKTSPTNHLFRYVSGSPFGCSKDYLVNSDQEAIALLMQEHACPVISIEAK